MTGESVRGDEGILGFDSIMCKCFGEMGSCFLACAIYQMEKASWPVGRSI
jgi:hypothetical protein